MNKQQLHLYVFFVLALVATWLFGKIILPYLTMIAIALVIAVLAYPLYLYFNEHLPWSGLASAITVVLVTGVILVPLVVFGTLMVDEALSLIAQLRTGGGDFSGVMESVESAVQSLIPTASFNIEQVAEQAFSLLADNLTDIFSSALHAFASVLIGIVLFYYLLKDGDHFRTTVIEKSPLGEENTRRILKKFTTVTKSVIWGNVVMALVQGALAGVGFWVFGVPNAILWAGVAAVMALIPAIGTTLVLLGGVIYVFINSILLMAAGLAVWSVILVGLIDDVLRPYVIGKRAHIHPVLVLISVVGGLAAFGAVGFILGPIILSLFIVVFEMWPEVVERKERKG